MSLRVFLAQVYGKGNKGVGDREGNSLREGMGEGCRGGNIILDRWLSISKLFFLSTQLIQYFPPPLSLYNTTLLSTQKCIFVEAFFIRIYTYISLHVNVILYGKNMLFNVKNEV